jgi:hydroxymethylbilane synthase
VKAALSSLRFGTRASALARQQTRRVISAIRDHHAELECDEVVIDTSGDRDRETPLPELGGTGVFTEALEAALIRDEVSAAVHSLKDLPINTNPQLVLAAICFRADPRDVLVSRQQWTLDTLPRGAVIGTSSPRRTAQLRLLRPDLEFVALRGNVETRVQRALAGQYDAICIAAAGVNRLGLHPAVSEHLSVDRILPAPGQGALAVQCHIGNEEARRYVAAIDDPVVRAAVEAERAFLAELGGGCSAPVGALAERRDGTDELLLRGIVLAPDGSGAIRVHGEANLAEAATLGRRLAGIALERGAGALLS